MKRTNQYQEKSARQCSGPIPINHLIKQYAIQNSIEGKSPRTIDSYNSILHRLARFLTNSQGEPTLHDFGLHTVREYILHLKTSCKYDGHPVTPCQNVSLSPGTIHAHVRTLRAFASWLEDEGYTETNILAKLKLPKVPRKLIVPLTDDEITAVLACCDSTTATGCRNRSIVMTLLDTGLRLTELVTLRIPDTHIEEGYVKVLGKGNKERVVPIGHRVQRMLWQYIERFRPEPIHPMVDNLLLTQEGQCLTSNAVKLMFERLSRRSDVERLHAHLLRHTFAVRYLLNGGDVFALQQILGHTTLEMVRRYVFLSEADITCRHRQFSPMDRLAIKNNSKHLTERASYPRRYH